MKRYPKYKDSGIEWLGEIPEHWKVKPLKFIGEIVLGKMLTNDDKGDYLKRPYLRAQNIMWEAVNIDDIKEMWFSERELRQYRLRENDILVSEGGEVGRTAIWKNELNECYIQNSVHKITINSNNNSHYYLYHFQVYGKIGYFDSIVHKVSIGHLTREKLKDIRFLSPLSIEQQNIKEYLIQKTNQIDTLIQKKQKQVDLLKEYRKAIINDAVIKGLNPNVKMKDSGIEWLGEIPEHWKVKKIKSLTKILRGQFSHRPRNDPRFYDGKYPFIQTGDVATADKYIMEYHQTLNELGYSVSKEFPKGTLVMTISANIGDIAMLNFPACFPDSIVGFIPFQDIYLNFFYFNLIMLRQEFIRTSTVNTQLNINVERIGNQYTVCPPYNEQVEISNYLDRKILSINDMVSQIEKQIQLLQEYRTSLISEVVTGKIDIRDKVQVPECVPNPI